MVVIAVVASSSNVTVSTTVFKLTLRTHSLRMLLSRQAVSLMYSELKYAHVDDAPATAKNV